MVALLVSPAARGEPQIVPLPPAPARPGAGDGPTPVFVTAWYADITKIDSVAQEFSANLAFILNWQDPRLAHSGPGVKTYALADVWHPRWLIVNEGNNVKRSLPERVDVTPGGEVVYRQRLVGSFTKPLYLQNFPFDRDTFDVKLVVLGYRPAEIELMPNKKSVLAGLKDGIGIAPKLTMQDWRVTGVRAFAEPYVLAPGVEVAGYALRFSAERRVQHYILKVFVPLVLIVVMSWAAFWIDPSQTAPQVSVAVTSMLTLIAYRFAVGAEVPKLPYLTRLDAFILVSSLLVFLTLVEVVTTTALAAHSRIDVARRIDRFSRCIFPILFVLVSVPVFFR